MADEHIDLTGSDEENAVKVSRRWCFTSYKTLATFETLFPDFIEEGVLFCVAQLEIGDNGREHMQGYIHFNRATRFSLVKRLLRDTSTHCEPAYGSAEQNRDYCTKESDRVDGPWTFGEINKCGKGSRNDVTGFTDALKSGKNFRDVVMENGATFVKFHSGLTKYYTFCQQIEQEKTPFEQLNVYVFHGPSGTGKSRRVRELEAPQNLYTIPSSQREGGGVWFDGYNGQSAILIEDFDSDIAFRTLLRLTDGYSGEQFPIKCGHIYKRWRRVYITTNKSPDNWYVNDPRINWECKCPPALKRRFTEVREFADP